MTSNIFDNTISLEEALNLLQNKIAKPSEVWILILEDGSTIEKRVVLDD